MTKKIPRVHPAAPDATPLAGTDKKGLGVCGEATTPDELSQLHLGWYYNWKPIPKFAPVPGVEFVPMFWGPSDLTPENLATVRRSAATHVLGFNEPDMEGQSNLTPAQCLEHWPKLMALKQRLGSPAPANSLWLDQFLPEARRRGLRIDFLCVHRYPDISDPHAADAIEQMLREVYDKYGMPVWLTEFGAANVAAWNQPRCRKPTAGMARTFLKNLLPRLERLPFVERYAWFADRVGGEYRLGTIFHPRASRLTPFGRIYRDRARPSS